MWPQLSFQHNFIKCNLLFASNSCRCKTKVTVRKRCGTDLWSQYQYKLIWPPQNRKICIETRRTPLLGVVETTCLCYLLVVYKLEFDAKSRGRSDHPKYGKYGYKYGKYGYKYGKYGQKYGKKKHRKSHKIVKKTAKIK